MKISAILCVAAALVTVSAAKHHTDPCTTLANEVNSNSTTLNFNTVRDCYAAQTYKPEIANQVLLSLERLLGNFYVFLDQAKASSPLPFVTPRVDLLADLKKIRNTKWKNDQEFNKALYLMGASPNDAHLAYINYCYINAIFVQPLVLYAPVIDGKQAARVLAATAGHGVPKDVTDCEVTHIDGKPALSAIQAFIDVSSGIAKDPGVRLNDALGSTSWASGWSLNAGDFSQRWLVPEKETMEYTIKCAKGPSRKVTLPWTVYRSSNVQANSFTDTASYWKTQCLAPPAAASTKKNTFDAKSPYTGLTDNRVMAKLPTDSVISHATEVLVTNTTAFYQLKHSDACVAVIATEEVNSGADYEAFVQGLTTLASKGCKKLIFDMTLNGGGSIDFAYFINQLLFPDALPYFNQDLRASKFAQGAASFAVEQVNITSIFDPRGWNSTATGQAFTNASMFTKGHNYRRGGTVDTYTQKNFFSYGWPGLLPLPANETLPWKASDMAIITNGFCGSACTMVAAHLRIAHNVKTYSIGGHHNKPLSFFTFPGGFVFQNGELVADIQGLGYQGKGGPVPLPVNGLISYPMGEIYAHDNRPVPLEYDTKYFAADVHYDQDPVSARHPDAVWVKIAKDMNKKHHHKH